MAQEKEEWAFAGDSNHDSIYGNEEGGLLHGEQLARAEWEAAARPGASARIEEVIDRLMDQSRKRGVVTTNTEQRDSPESPPPIKANGSEHYEGERTSDGRVWHCINGT